MKYRSDLIPQITGTLHGDTGFDTDAISREIWETYGREINHVDEIPGGEYWAIVERYQLDEDPAPAEDRTHSQEFYFVVQRRHFSAKGPQWVDASSSFYGEHGRDAATGNCDRMRGIFGRGKVRVVRRDVLVTETHVEG